MAHFAGRVKTFSIGFEGYPEWDETKYARLVAQRYDTEHTEFKVRPESFDLIDKLAWHYDEPFGDSSAIPTAIVAQLTRKKVTVALTGDGGDELFAGYFRFAGVAYAELVPGFLRGLGRSVLEAIPHGDSERALWERARRHAMRATLPLPERLRSWISLFSASELSALLQPEYVRYAIPSILGASYAELDRRATQLDPLNRVLFLNARTYLLDDLNVKMDRACMAASLEARAPFLDTALMEYTFSLPGALKLRGKSFKWVLKRAMADLLPYEVVHRKKMGFGVPLGAWFRGALKDALRERLLADGAHVHQFVRREALERLLDLHQEGKRDLGLAFWSLWLLELWLRAQRRAPGAAAAG
jgi:asparagine synthase (glutamine-hydrolysing)